MRATFLLGLIAGLASVLGLAFAAPFLAQVRVRADTEVQTNGGRQELFHIRVDQDTLMQAPGTESVAETIPADADWFPELAPFAGVAAVYRLRNTSDEVIGVASRVRGMQAPEHVEWILYFPARGMLALDGASVDTVEVGDVVGGDREFANLSGDWQVVLDESNILRLTTRLAARLPDEALEEPDQESAPADGADTSEADVVAGAAQ